MSKEKLAHRLRQIRFESELKEIRDNLSARVRLLKIPLSDTLESTISTRIRLVEEKIASGQDANTELRDLKVFIAHSIQKHSSKYQFSYSFARMCLGLGGLLVLYLYQPSDMLLLCFVVASCALIIYKIKTILS